MEQVRSFIAVELPDELKTELIQLQARLKSERPSGVKWVDPNGIHLTLKFLGDVDVARLSDITTAMTTAARGIFPFQLEVRGLGVFPNLRRVQVAWVGLEGEVDKLVQLQQSIEFNLAYLGFTPESRAFTPHLTLARLQNRASPDERQRLGQLIASNSFEASQAIKISAVNLMRSQLTKEGAIYRHLSSVELKKPLSTAAD